MRSTTPKGSAHRDESNSENIKALYHSVPILLSHFLPPHVVGSCTAYHHKIIAQNRSPRKIGQQFWIFAKIAAIFGSFWPIKCIKMQLSQHRYI